MTYQADPIMFADIGGLFLLSIGLFALAFWIWMIVDCLKHETEGSTKIAWLLVILLAGVIGAPLYFFLRRLPRQNRARYQSVAPVYQPWDKHRGLSDAAPNAPNERRRTDDAAVVCGSTPVICGNRAV
jgi:hypothetical protein